jgi:biopolymer transport protein ExbB
MKTESWVSKRLTWFVLAAVLCMALAIVGSRAVAAEGEEEAKPAAAEEGGADAPKSQAKQTMSAFEWFIHSSGLIGLFILLLSIYFVATVCQLFWTMRLPVAIPPEITGRVQDLLGQRDFKGVFSVVKDDDSVFSRMLSTGITELPNGLAEARDVMDRVGEAIHVEMEKKISILAVLGTLGPMIGLLGTLKGMIASFSVIAMYDTTLKASQVAGGISEALLLTFEGVFLSVPAIYFFSFFRNRVSVITTTAAMEADNFLRHFAHAARAKPGGAPAGGQPAKAAPRLE